MIRLKEHLDEMLVTFGDCFSIDDIKEYYAKRFYVELKEDQLNIIKRFMLKNYANFQYNEKHHSFETEESKDNYLFVEDNKYFNSIEDVMKNLFGYKTVQRQKGWFKVSTDPEINAWFPQFGNKEWENLFLDNGKTWTERPLTQKNIEKFSNQLTNEYRYIFIHEKEGYRFTGLFCETSIINGNTRIYSLYDKKLLIKKDVEENGFVTTNEVDSYVKELISLAKSNGDSTIKIGFYTIREHFGERVMHRAPTVCNAIRKNMNEFDRIIYQSPKGNSSLFEVEFDLNHK